jgi:hypothetical protein
MSAVISRQSELETNLKIARSNLALAENHAEALEDTLKRNPSSRLSNGSGTMLGYSPVPPPVPSFSNYTNAAGTAASLTIRTSNKSPNLHQGSFGDSQEPESATAPSPRLGSFWKRRPTFGTSSHPNLEALVKQQQNSEETPDTHTGKRASTSLGITHPEKQGNAAAKASHRLSYETGSEDESSATIMRRPSFGMLRSSSANVPGNSNDKAQAAFISSLQSQLAQSKHAYSVLQTEFQTLQQNHTTLSNKYSSLQDEIENLSVSLFEEANTMVAEERKVNHFLNESLDKTKTEVDDLQKQVDDLKAALLEKDRITSPALSMKSNRRRTSISSHLSHPSRSRRRSSIAALDALESYVTSSPRRASRDLAAAAAAVRSLGQSHNSDLPSLPHSASVSSFNKLQMSASHPTRLPVASVSAPSSATLPMEPVQLLSQSSLQITTEHDEDQFDTLRRQPAGGSSKAESKGTEGTSLDPLESHEDQASTSASSLRARWFSFGSRRRPKQDTQRSLSQAGSPSPVPASSPISASPIDAASRSSPAPEGRTSPRAPPRSPDRNQRHTRLNSNFSPEMFKPGLPKVTEGSSHHQYVTSPSVSLAQNVQHLVSPSARSTGHSRTQSSNSLKNMSTSRPTSPFSPAGTDSSSRMAGLNRSLSAFSSPASRRPGTGPRELILLSGGSASSSPRSVTHSPRREIAQLQQSTSAQSLHQANKSADDSLTISRSPSQPRYMPVAELHSILDQTSADELPTSFSRLASPTGDPAPQPTTVPFAAMQEQLEPASKAGTTSLRTHKKSWSISSDASRTSTPVDERPASRNNVVSPNLVAESSVRTTSQALSSDDVVPLTLSKTALPRLRPIVTNAAVPSRLAPNGNDAILQDQISPFALPTPPIFKQFSRETSYRKPLYSPSKSDAVVMRRTGSGGLGSAKDLQRSGSTASNASFNRGFDLSRYGLQRQGSSMSVATGTGSVVEDLDTLMRSIDAISESLGLEGDGLDASFYEQAIPSSP